MFDFRDRKIRQLFIIIVAWFVILMLASSAYVMQRMQRQKIESGLDLVSLQARSFEDYLTQSFNNIDLTLRNIPALQENALPSLDVFKLALRNAPHLRALSLVDGQGYIKSSSNPDNIGKQIDTRNFIPPIDSQSGVLRIGVPWIGRDIANGTETTPEHPAEPDALSFLPAAQNITINNQPFILLASVNTDFFLNHISQHVPEHSGYVEIMRQDHTVLLSTNEKQKSGEKHPRSEDDLNEQSPHRVLEQNIDGRPVLTAFHASRIFPFIVHVHLDQKSMLKQWQQQMQLMLALVGASVIAVIGFSVFIYKRLLRSAQLQEAADEQLRLSAQVFKSSTEAIFIATSDLKVYSVNRAFTEITGYAASEVIGLSPTLLYANPKENSTCPNCSEITPRSPWTGEVSHRRKTGELYPANMIISCIQDDTGKITHFIGVFSDTTERKVSERFRFLSEHDFLTGLPNRRLFQDHFEQSIARINRHGGQLAVLFLDLDHFKSINDTLGHHIGDLLLKEVAARLRSCVRATDTVCRQGGDEFLLLIDVIEDAQDATRVAEKLLDSIGAPYKIGEHQLEVTPSIGIALYPYHGEDYATLIHHADIAMYQSKHHGRNHFCFYHESMDSMHKLVSVTR